MYPTKTGAKNLEGGIYDSRPVARSWASQMVPTVAPLAQKQVIREEPRKQAANNHSVSIPTCT